MIIYVIANPPQHNSALMCFRLTWVHSKSELSRFRATTRTSSNLLTQLQLLPGSQIWLSNPRSIRGARLALPLVLSHSHNKQNVFSQPVLGTFQIVKAQGYLTSCHTTGQQHLCSKFLL